MIDLTSKSVEEINELIKKYSSILDVIKPQQQPYFAYIIDIAVKHINEKYVELNNIWKAWSVVVVKKKIDSINTESDIIKMIDGFVMFYNTEYAKYCDEMSYYCEEDIITGFVHQYSCTN